MIIQYLVIYILVYLLHAHLNIYFLHTLFSRSKNEGSIMSLYPCTFVFLTSVTITITSTTSSWMRHSCT